MLRVYVHEAMQKKDDRTDLLKLLPMLARMEEARIRLDARSSAPDNPVLQALRDLLDEVRSTNNSENRI